MASSCGSGHGYAVDGAEAVHCRGVLEVAGSRRVTQARRPDEEDFGLLALLLTMMTLPNYIFGNT